MRKRYIAFAATVFIGFSCTKETDDSIELKEPARDLSHLKSNISYDSVADFEGNIYKTVMIGGVEWMAENLRATKFSNGDSIPYVEETWWEHGDSIAYCYPNGKKSNKHPYGLLYNWYVAVDSRNPCPEGWKVPTTGEWNRMIDSLGGKQIAGQHAKTVGTKHWKETQSAVDNASGFSGLPAGNRWRSGEYANLTSYGRWWASNFHYPGTSFFFQLATYDSSFYQNTRWSKSGLCIRCIRKE
ncbi:MAG: fibrobacter succinogenes major paralogous domain-containing protein [Cryomorphaceae bacterium]|nr:fibrobacter succinogenes major paralogous domain-containing protein [Cryomorphaceae bacterium]